MSQFVQSVGFAHGASWLSTRDGVRFKSLLRRANKLDEAGRPEQATKTRARADKLLRSVELKRGENFFGPVFEPLYEGEIRCLYRSQGMEFL